MLIPHETATLAVLNLIVSGVLLLLVPGKFTGNKKKNDGNLNDDNLAYVFTF